MLEDLQAILSDKQDVGSGGAATVYCTNAYDLGSPGSDVQGNTAPSDAGNSHLMIDSRVTTAFANGTSVQLDFIQSSNSDLSSPDVLESTPAIAVASLTAGYKFGLTRFPTGITKRYVGVRYVVVGATTVGNITTAVIGSVFPA
ncbi:MAG: hypothetical protein JST54_12540 [Deltaproteobacteria bacterium]|nr:hypothetical protein [Deltaproteobacteria bacterium]